MSAQQAFTHMYFFWNDQNVAFVELLRVIMIGNIYKIYKTKNTRSFNESEFEFEKTFVQFASGEEILTKQF